MADILYKIDDRYGICVHIDGCARAMRIFSSKLQNEIVERNANLYPGKNGPYSIKCMYNLPIMLSITELEEFHPNSNKINDTGYIQNQSKFSSLNESVHTINSETCIQFSVSKSGTTQCDVVFAVSAKNANENLHYEKIIPIDIFLKDIESLIVVQQKDETRAKEIFSAVTDEQISNFAAWMHENALHNISLSSNSILCAIEHAQKTDTWSEVVSLMPDFERFSTENLQAETNDNSKPTM